MFIDWNNNGEFDAFDMGVTLAVLEEEEKEKAEEEQERLERFDEDQEEE